MMSEEFGSDYVVLADEEGNEKEFEILDSIETDDARYVALLPLPEDEQEEESEEAEVVILRVETEDGEDVFATIEDEEELEKAYEIFMKRMEEETPEEE